MKRIIIGTVSLLTLFFLIPKLIRTIDSRQTGTTVTNTPKPEPQEYDEVWMMRGWQGLMCVVIATRGDHADYWMTSCMQTSQDPNTPIVCGLRRTTTHLHLKPPVGQLPNDDSWNYLYDTKWKFVTENAEAFLAGKDDLENNRDTGRYLQSIDPEIFTTYLTKRGPFFLQFNPQLHKPQTNPYTFRGHDTWAVTANLPK